MKKKWICVVMMVSALALAMLAGCGKKDDETNDTPQEIALKDVDVESIVKLGEYKGLKVQVPEKEVSEEELDEEIEELLKKVMG